MGFFSRLFGGGKAETAASCGDAASPAKCQGRAGVAALDDPAANRRLLLIGGMHCEKCEARVKAALESVDGVLAARPQHDVGNAMLALAKDVPDSVLEEAVRQAGFDPRGVRNLAKPAASMELPDWDAGVEDATHGALKRVLSIEGMQCPRCEARVRNALDAIDGVSMSVVSWQDKSAIVDLSKNVPDSLLRQAVQGAGYTYLGVKAYEE